MRSPLFLLYLAVFVAISGFGMVFPLLPFYAQTFGASPTQIGFLAASFSIAQFLASPLVGRASDRFGRKPILGLALLGTSVSFLIFSLASSLPWLFFSRALHGVFSSGAFPIAAAYIGDVTTKKERVKFMGRLTATFSLGFIVGPALSGFLVEKGYTLPFLTAAAVAFLNSLFIFFFLPESLTQKAEKLILKEGLVNIKAVVHGLRGEFGILFFLLFSWAFAISNFQVALPLFAEEKFVSSASQIALVFTFAGTVGALVQFLILPQITKWFGEHLTVALGTLIMGVAQFLISLSPNFAFLLFFSSTSTLGGSFLRPTINAILSKETKEGQGTTMGLAFSFESSGRVAGPLLAGILIATLGTQSQFVLTSLILFFGFFLMLKELRTTHGLS